MSKLYDTVGTSTPEQILAKVEADPIAINLLPGQGELKRGMLLYKNASGFYVKATTSQISTSYDLVVLNENIDTGNDGTAIAEVAAAYREGTFIEGKVTYDDSSTPTAVTEAHKVVLRLFGIKFAQSVESSGTFANGPVTITYVANNAVTPAEADVAIEAQRGSTYTILNNSAENLSFTAPATKEFKKWNTKADGSGTDYAAAASYTASADLKLYAVWGT